MTSGRRTSEGERERSQMIGGDPKTEVGVPFPSAEVRHKKGSFLSNARGRRTIAILLRAKDKRLTETRRTPSPSSQYTKNRTKSISPWKKKNSPVEPRQKNKISNFGTFFLYTQILFTTLSLSIWKRIKARKRHLHSWTILLYVWHFTERIYIYIYI